MNIPQEITKEIVKSFLKKRIVSLLYYGTRAFVGSTKTSDYDFMLILDKYSVSDLFILRKLVNKNNFKRYDLNINLLYYSDIVARRKENFQIRSVQSDHYNYLEVAIVLIGNNIFAAEPYEISREKLTDIMNFKIQEYYGRCDKLCLQKNDNKKLFLQLRKYIKDIIRFILIREGLITLKDIVSFSFEDLFKLASKSNLFPERLVSKFKFLLSEYNGPNDIKVLEVLRRGVYDKYLELYVSDLETKI